MEQITCFTAGEIKKFGLIKTFKNTPLRSMSGIHRILNILSTSMIKTPYGLAKVLTQEQINNYNKEKIIFSDRKLLPITKV